LAPLSLNVISRIMKTKSVVHTEASNSGELETEKTPSHPFRHAFCSFF
jgi:hypothetical protein